MESVKALRLSSIRSKYLIMTVLSYVGSFDFVIVTL